ncbi:universal stress protein [Phenylobacterium sp. J426]|uniref:universal stress protein n=1 Tax=Phenylobacterium sp. J426 TaxID=2898439 RepID=UPI002151974D|nr:universal stress protein [Phenylobacterium sp. J426]MCR5872794.1 universal stress protein [Phenylobacterium sp. J426]
MLIATDGSDLATEAVRQGAALAKSLGSKVTLLTVTEGIPIYMGLDGGVSAVMYDDFSAATRQYAKKALADAAAAVAPTGVAVETAIIENASPAEAIVEAAKARACDLIVLSSHGRRGLSRLILGSVTAEVLAKSTVSVLVVR